MLDAQPTSNWRHTKKMDIAPSAGLKKCLFDKPEDSQSLESDLDRELDKIRAADRFKWNFDFKRERPLAGGRYQWELNAPLPQPDVKVAASRNDRLSDGNSEEESDGGSCLDSPTSSMTSTPVYNRSLIDTPVDSPNTQRRLSEFFRQKKRCSPSIAGSSVATKKSRSTQRSLDFDNGNQD